MITVLQEPIPLFVFFLKKRFIYYKMTLVFTNSYPTTQTYIRGAQNKFPDILGMGTFVDSTLMKI